MTPFAIAGVQMHVTAQNNIAAIARRIEVLMHLYPWVQMVLLSELSAYGPLLSMAQPLPGAAEEAFQEMAARYRIWLINGSMFERREGVIHNTTSVVNPVGEIVGRYRKMFPFVPMEHGVTPGREFLIFDVPNVGRFGVLNCYDIWFPEVARTLTSMGAEVLLHPVLTHTIDRDIDLNIAQATAAMFQCYVFDINGLGVGGNGLSAVVDPSGRLMFRADTLEQLIPIEIDLEQVRRQRSNGFRGLGQVMKSFRDRPVDFPVYDARSRNGSYLDSLGPIFQPDSAQAQPADQPAFHASPRAHIVG